MNQTMACWLLDVSVAPPTTVSPFGVTSTELAPEVQPVARDAFKSSVVCDVAFQRIAWEAVGATANPTR